MKANCVSSFYTVVAVTFDRRIKGCQLVYFQTKNPNLVKFWRFLQCKMFVYFMAFWSILRPFGQPILRPFGQPILRPFDFLYGHLVYVGV
jgi:hypothetical protein